MALSSREALTFQFHNGLTEDKIVAQATKMVQTALIKEGMHLSLSKTATTWLSACTSDALLGLKTIPRKNIKIFWTRCSCKQII